MSSPQTVATSTLFDYLTDITGAAISGATIHCTLNYSAGATVASPAVSIGPIQKSTTTDANGYWQLTLVSNVNIAPANTTYTIQTPYNAYDVTVGTAGPYQSTAAGTIVNVPVPLSPATSALIGPVTVTGNETVTGNLTVNGSSSLQGGIVVAGGATVTGGTTFSGGTTISNGETVTGGETLTGNFTMLTAASRLIAGATSFAIRDSANANDNLLISNAGVITGRGALTTTGEITGTDFKPTGLTGVVAASRYAGAVASGAPASGTFAVGDFTIDLTGRVWVCTVAGTPGTWVAVGGGNYHAEVYLAGAQSIPNNTTTQIAYDTVEGDPNSNFTTGASAHYTCPVAGRYLVSANATWNNSAAAAGVLYATIYKNSAEHKRGTNTSVSNTSSSPSQQATAVVRAAASDTLDIRCNQLYGGATGLLSGAAFTWAQFTFLGS